MKEVALVLSSGGARGIAHIGAIEELESRGYVISSIAGCSMGSLVGGMYASGNLGVFKEWLFTIDKKRIWSLSDISISWNSIVKGDKIIRELKKIIPDCNMEDFVVPCTMVATDIRSEREVVFDSGSMYEAIRASISMPFFLKPKRKDKMLLVDGGLINPLPLNRVDASDGRIVVAVNVSAFDRRADKSSPKDKPQSGVGALSYIKLKAGSLLKTDEEESTPGMYTIIDNAFGIMIEQNCELSAQLFPPDVIVNVPMNSYSGFEYNKARELYDLGRQLMCEELDRFERGEEI